MREARPDVLLLDLRMPGMDGREALRRIRADLALRDTRVVAVTASSLLDEEPELKAAFDGYVRKPITREALSAELVRLFGRIDRSPDVPTAAKTMPPASADGLDEAALVGARSDIDEIAARCVRARETLSTQSLTELERRIESANSWLAGVFAESVERLRGARERFELAAMETALEEIESRCGELARTLDARRSPT